MGHWRKTNERSKKDPCSVRRKLNKKNEKKTIVYVEKIHKRSLSRPRRKEIVHCKRLGKL